MHRQINIRFLKVVHIMGVMGAIIKYCCLFRQYHICLFGKHKYLTIWFIAALSTYILWIVKNYMKSYGVPLDKVQCQLYEELWCTSWQGAVPIHSPFAKFTKVFTIKFNFTKITVLKRAQICDTNWIYNKIVNPCVTNVIFPHKWMSKDIFWCKSSMHECLNIFIGVCHKQINA